MATEGFDHSMFGPGPARDDRFVVKDQWVECANFPEGDPAKKFEFMHRQMNEEMNVMENAARSLADFPDAEWELRMWLARQCSDEARHVLAYRRLFESHGGHVGQYPVLNFQYRILGSITTLIGRLAVQNRTFEADGLDAATRAHEEAVAEGDEPLAAMLDAQQADEVLHIRFANEYIRRTVTATPRAALHMASALTLASRAFAQVWAHGGTHVTKYGVAEEHRLAAGFAPEEVRFAVEQSAARREAVERGGA